VHPLGGSVLVQAEEVGEDGSGELGGEVEEGGAAAGLGVDAEGPEPSAERGRGDGAAGQVPGEQPGGLLRGADAAVSAPVVERWVRPSLMSWVMVLASGPGTGTSWRPSRMSISSPERVTWLVVMTAMRDSGCP
jgi:hypothetical protein